MSRVRLWLLDILMGKEKNGMAIDFLRYYAVISHKNTEGGIPL